MQGWLVANVIVAALLTGLYAWVKYKLKWFNHDHLKVPVWMTLTAFPVGFAVPASKLAIDGMLIVAAIYSTQIPRGVSPGM